MQVEQRQQLMQDPDSPSLRKALELEQCANAEQWAFGPKVNVISEYCRLEHPVQHSGALSTWRISDDALPLVQCGLASATRCKNDVSHLPAGGSVGPA